MPTVCKQMCENVQLVSCSLVCMGVSCVRVRVLAVRVVLYSRHMAVIYRFFKLFMVYNTATMHVEKWLHIHLCMSWLCSSLIVLRQSGSSACISDCDVSVL